MMIVVYICAVILAMFLLRQFYRVYKETQEDDKPKVIKVYWGLLALSIVTGIGISLVVI